MRRAIGLMRGWRSTSSGGVAGAGAFCKFAEGLTWRQVEAGNVSAMREFRDLFDEHLRLAALAA
jgi:hypothetical protein